MKIIKFIFISSLLCMHANNAMDTLLARTKSSPCSSVLQERQELEMRGIKKAGIIFASLVTFFTGGALFHHHYLLSDATKTQMAINRLKEDPYGPMAMDHLKSQGYEEGYKQGLIDGQTRCPSSLMYKGEENTSITRLKEIYNSSTVTPIILDLQKD